MKQDRPSNALGGKSKKIISTLIVFILLATVFSPVANSGGIISSIISKVKDSINKDTGDKVQAPLLGERFSHMKELFYKLRDRFRDRLLEFKNRAPSTDTTAPEVTKGSSKLTMLRSISSFLKISRSSSFLSLFTNYSGVEKITPLKLGLPVSVDVDDDGNKDIKVKCSLYLSLEKPFALSLNFKLNVDRLSGFKDINESFEVYVVLTFPGLLKKDMKGDQVKFGYQSDKGEEMPSTCYVTYKYTPYFFSEKKPKHIITLDPGSISDKDNLSLIFSFSDVNVSSYHEFRIKLEPAVKTTVDFTGETGKVGRYLSLTTSKASTAVIKYNKKQNNQEINVGLIIYKISDFSFKWEITPFQKGGGLIEYERNSTNPVDALLFFENNRSLYFYVDNLPKHVKLSWDPSNNNIVELNSSGEKCGSLGVRNGLTDDEVTFKAYLSNLPSLVRGRWDWDLVNGWEVSFYSENQGCSAHIYGKDINAGFVSVSELKADFYSDHDFNFSFYWNKAEKKFGIKRTSYEITTRILVDGLSIGNLSGISADFEGTFKNTITDPFEFIIGKTLDGKIQVNFTGNEFEISDVVFDLTVPSVGTFMLRASNISFKSKSSISFAFSISKDGNEITVYVRIDVVKGIHVTDLMVGFNGVLYRVNENLINTGGSVSLEISFTITEGNVDWSMSEDGSSGSITISGGLYITFNFVYKNSNGDTIGTISGALSFKTISDKLFIEWSPDGFNIDGAGVVALYNFSMWVKNKINISIPSIIGEFSINTINKSGYIKLKVDSRVVSFSVDFKIDIEDLMDVTLRSKIHIDLNLNPSVDLFIQWSEEIGFKLNVSGIGTGINGTVTLKDFFVSYDMHEKAYFEASVDKIEFDGDFAPNLDIYIYKKNVNNDNETSVVLRLHKSKTLGYSFSIEGFFFRYSVAEVFYDEWGHLVDYQREFVLTIGKITRQMDKSRDLEIYINMTKKSEENKILCTFEASRGSEFHVYDFKIYYYNQPTWSIITGFDHFMRTKDRNFSVYIDMTIDSSEEQIKMGDIDGTAKIYLESDGFIQLEGAYFCYRAHYYDKNTKRITTEILAKMSGGFNLSTSHSVSLIADFTNNTLDYISKGTIQVTDFEFRMGLKTGLGLPSDNLMSPNPPVLPLANTTLKVTCGAFTIEGASYLHIKGAEGRIVEFGAGFSIARILDEFYIYFNASGKVRELVVEGTFDFSHTTTFAISYVYEPEYEGIWMGSITGEGYTQASNVYIKYINHNDSSKSFLLTCYLLRFSGFRMTEVELTSVYLEGTLKFDQSMKIEELEFDRTEDNSQFNKLIAIHTFDGYVGASLWFKIMFGASASATLNTYNGVDTRVTMDIEIFKGRAQEQKLLGFEVDDFKMSGYLHVDIDFVQKFATSTFGHNTSFNRIAVSFSGYGNFQVAGSSNVKGDLKIGWTGSNPLQPDGITVSTITGITGTINTLQLQKWNNNQWKTIISLTGSISLTSGSLTITDIQYPSKNLSFPSHFKVVGQGSGGASSGFVFSGEITLLNLITLKRISLAGAVTYELDASGSFTSGGTSSGNLNLEITANGNVNGGLCLVFPSTLEVDFDLALTSGSIIGIGVNDKTGFDKCGRFYVHGNVDLDKLIVKYANTDIFNLQSFVGNVQSSYLEFGIGKQGGEPFVWLTGSGAITDFYGQIGPLWQYVLGVWIDIESVSFSADVRAYLKEILGSSKTEFWINGQISGSGHLELINDKLGIYKSGNGASFNISANNLKVDLPPSGGIRIRTGGATSFTSCRIGVAGAEIENDLQIYGGGDITFSGPLSLNPIDIELYSSSGISASFTRTRINPEGTTTFTIDGDLIKGSGTFTFQFDSGIGKCYVHSPSGVIVWLNIIIEWQNYGFKWQSDQPWANEWTATWTPNTFFENLEITGDMDLNAIVELKYNGGWKHIWPIIGGGLTVNIGDDPYEGEVNELIQFQGTVTGGSSPYRWRWDFNGDDVWEVDKWDYNQGATNPTWSYSAPYHSYVKARVTDSSIIEKWGVDYAWVDVNYPPVHANGYGPYRAPRSTPIPFQGDATGGLAPYSYYWTFGDGSTSNQEDPTHQYANNGNYTVTLTVTDAYGTTDTYSTYADIAPDNWDIISFTGPGEVWEGCEYQYTVTVSGLNGKLKNYKITWPSGYPNPEYKDSTEDTIIFKHTFYAGGGNAIARVTYNGVYKEKTLYIDCEYYYYSTINGRVYDHVKETGISNAKVEFTGLSECGYTKTVYTDTQGFYSCTIDKYVDHVTVSHNDYITHEETYYIESNSRINPKNFNLEPDNLAVYVSWNGDTLYEAQPFNVHVTYNYSNTPGAQVTYEYYKLLPPGWVTVNQPNNPQNTDSNGYATFNAMDLGVESSRTCRVKATKAGYDLGYSKEFLVWNPVLNQQPNPPIKPTGPTSGEPGHSYTYSTSAIDPDGDLVKYGWDWDGDGVVNQWTDHYHSSGATESTVHSWDSIGIYNVKVKAKDEHGQEGGWSDTLEVTITQNNPNNPPNTPNQPPTGPTSGEPGYSYTYNIITTDPNPGDTLYYWFDWGDGTNSGWKGPYNQGESGSASKTWTSSNNFNVKAKAKDNNEAESGWSPVLIVHIQANQPPVLGNPAITGPTEGKKGESLTFVAHATDPNGDSMQYRWRSSLFPLGTGWFDENYWSCSFPLTGTKYVQVKVKDEHGLETDWSPEHNVIITTCFSGDTKVLMANENLKEIKDIKIGDIVRSYDVKTNTYINATVEHIFSFEPEQMKDHYLLINNNLKVTPDHLIFVDGNFIEAGNIQIGNRLQDNNGKQIIVNSIEKIYEQIPTYNIALDDGFTYFANGILVFSSISVAETIKFNKSIERVSGGTTFEITVTNGTDVVGGATVLIKYKKLYCGEWTTVGQSYTDLEHGKCTVTVDGYYGTFKVFVEDDELGTIESEELQGADSFVVTLDYMDLGTTFKVKVYNGKYFVGGADVLIMLKGENCEWETVGQDRTVYGVTNVFVKHKGVFKVVVEDDKLGKIESKELQGRSSYIVNLNYDPAIINKQLVHPILLRLIEIFPMLRLLLKL
jgi:PKD repeat protein